MNGMIYQVRRRKALSQKELFYIITHWSDIPEHRKIIVECTVLWAMLVQYLHTIIYFPNRR
jgi:hypothetical protein